jgi:predicted acyl esterase
MTWRRRVALLLLPLFVLSSGRPIAQNPARTSFPPAEVPPRNDIRVDNRVAIPMRDGVNLYADVYRPVGEGRFPILVSRTPYSTERFPAAYEAGVYNSAPRRRSGPRSKSSITTPSVPRKSCCP